MTRTQSGVATNTRSNAMAGPLTLPAVKELHDYGLCFIKESIQLIFEKGVDGQSTVKQ